MHFLPMDSGLYVLNLLNTMLYASRIAPLISKKHDWLLRDLISRGVDFIETFSTVFKTSTIQVILALEVQFDWSVRQLDVSNAFLHKHLLEEVYI